jgi:hypothetical protein
MRKSSTIREKKNPIFSQSTDTNGIPTRYKQQQQQQKPVPREDVPKKCQSKYVYINTIKQKDDNLYTNTFAVYSITIFDGFVAN